MCSRYRIHDQQAEAATLRLRREEGATNLISYVWWNAWPFIRHRNVPLRWILRAGLHAQTNGLSGLRRLYRICYQRYQSVLNLSAIDFHLGQNGDCFNQHVYLVLLAKRRPANENAQQVMCPLGWIPPQIVTSDILQEASNGD